MSASTRICRASSSCVLDDLGGLLARMGVRRELLADDGT